MMLNIISIVINVVFFIILNLDLYTDQVYLPDGIKREWHGSPIDRLYAADKNVLLYLYIFLAAVSILTGILLLAGIRNNVVKTVQLVAAIASVLVFIIIMAVAGNTHPTY